MDELITRAIQSVQVVNFLPVNDDFSHIDVQVGPALDHLGLQNFALDRGMPTVVVERVQKAVSEDPALEAGGIDAVV